MRGYEKSYSIVVGVFLYLSINERMSETNEEV